MPGVPESATADIKGDFVVFHIGFSAQNWWQVRSWLPVGKAMAGMLKELKVFLRPRASCSTVTVNKMCHSRFLRSRFLLLRELVLELTADR